ncbi:MAG TPA: tetratricopeptide repeat protein [Desulfobacterales bacterium]|nr:tetratricopeptide repeat protein [Desulfobacterales bacterium]HIP38048.1 tetratricopeptide repeat protein [Desulfocapsa sulfexigens]
MIYNNLLFFLIAIFLFTMTSGTEVPPFPFPVAFLFFSALLFLYDFIARRMFAKTIKNGSGAYFDTEKRLSLLALLFYSTALFTCDIHYYLTPLSLNGRFPSFTNIGGLFFFFLFLFLMWRRSQAAYEVIFERQYTTTAFLISNSKTNLPIILPWVFLSLAYDLLALLPFPQLRVFLHSEPGEYLSFVIFLLLILIFFPPLVRRLWGCTPFPEGPLLNHLQAFFKKQNFSADIFTWPLFEGRVITAGVMGIIPGLRYVMITPALLQHLSLEELDAVMAHEIGHIKKKHMLLYLLIIAGFSILTGFFLEPFIFFIASRDSFYSLLRLSGLTLENMFAVIVAISILVLLVLYFRFLFGYFIRNFERQADLHVFEAIGSSHTLISAFEKIAILSGNIRDLPSWHHFGIGQRVEFLEKCEADPSWIIRHNRKIKLSLFLYILSLLLAVSGQQILPSNSWKALSEEKYTEYILEKEIAHEPDKVLWLTIVGDLLQHKKMEKKALAAYDKALALEPSNPKLLNNLAWLLLTSEDPKLRDPERALDLARLAAMQIPASHVLDTLATAYWANGFIEKAIDTEKKALFKAPTEGRYYREQIEKFRNTTYDSKAKPTAGMNDEETL